MSPRMQKQIAKSKEEALAAFVSKKAEIDAMLTRLQALSDDHFNYSPDEIDLGPRRHPRVLRRAAQAGHRQRLQRGRARRVSAPISRPRPARPAAAGARGRRRAMVLSDDGDHPMTKLSDTQLVILSAAAQRADLSVLPLPDGLNAQGRRPQQGDGQPPQPRPDPGPRRRRRTRAGGHHQRGHGRDRRRGGRRRGAARAADTAPTSAEADSAADAPAPATEADGAAKPAKRKPAKGEGQGDAGHQRAARPPASRPRSPRRAPAPSRRR